MKAKITRELLRETKPNGKTIDIMDTDVKGFAVRITRNGAVHYAIRYTDKRGRQARYSLGMSFPTTGVSEAREEARKLLGRIAAGENPAEEKKVQLAGRLTLLDFIDDTYGDYLKGKSKTAEATIKRLKAQFANLKDTPLTEIDALTITKWRTARRKAGIAASTVNRDIGALKPLFTRAAEWKLLPENPLSSVKPLKNTADPIVRYLSDDEESRLRTAMKQRDARDRAGRSKANEWRATRRYNLLPDLAPDDFTDYLHPAVLLSLNTGIRQGELTSLLWADVSLEKGAFLFVRGAVAKSSKGRHVPLNDEAKEILARWKSQQSDNALVFPSADGKPIAEVKTAWRNLLENADIENFRWHDMRHHFASRLVMAGVDLNTVRELLGHSDLKMTLRYSHLAPEHKSAAVQKLMRKA